MVKLSTADFIGLLSNLRDDVDIDVALKISSRVVIVPDEYKLDDDKHQCCASVEPGVKPVRKATIQDSFSKNKTPEEMMEASIDNVFVILGYTIDRSFNAAIADYFVSRYHCYDTHSTIDVRHPFECPPEKFTVLDRGITKNYILLTNIPAPKTTLLTTKILTVSFVDLDKQFDRPTIDSIHNKGK